MTVDEGTFAQTLFTGLILSVFLGFLIWGIRTGQFRNVEDAKYRMLKGDKKDNEEADTESQPGKKPGGEGQ